jgi:hypothetical protein
MVSFSGYLEVANFSQHRLRDTKDISGWFAKASAVKKAASEEGLIDGDTRNLLRINAVRYCANRYSPSAKLQLVKFQTAMVSGFEILDQEWP